MRSEMRPPRKPSTRVFFPDPVRLSELGYESIAHVPVLFGPDGGYLSEANLYLRERATLSWPEHQSAAHKIVLGRTVKFPGFETLKKLAYSLGNFFDWLRERNYEWRKIQYTPHVREYRSDQISGKWSALPGDHLRKRTAEPRADCATDFLAWSASRQLRQDFVVPVTRVYRRFSSDTSSRPSVRTGTRRAGRGRPDPVDLRLPELEELTDWLDRVYEKRGYTKTLACRTILATGIRRQEAALLPFDFLSMHKSDWHITADRVQFLLTEGTKFGVERHVTVSLKLAEELHSYRVSRRLTALAKWSKRNRGRLPKPTQLFLGSYDGTPLSAPTIYDAWTSARIFSGWSPHLGRHTWACYELLYHINSEAARMGIGTGGAPVQWIEQTAKTMISLFITPQLGHIEEATTKIYLRWLVVHFTLPGAYNAYHAALES